MIYYLLILAVLFVLGFLDVTDDEVFPKYKYILLACSFIFILIFAGFRFESGYDFRPYRQIFNKSGFFTIMKESNMEPGFAALICVLKKLGFGFSALIFLMAFASISVKYKIIKEYSVYPFVSLIVYFSSNFIIQDFGQIRQGLAVGLTLYSIRYIKDKNLFKYLIIMFIAIMFHYSAVIFLPMYWMAQIKVNRKVIFSTIGLATVMFILSKSGVLDFIVLKVINQPYITYKYLAYMSGDGGIGIFKFTLLTRVVIFIAFYMLRDKIEPKCKYYNILLMLYLLSIFMFVAFNFNEGLALRGAIYFKIVEILIIPLIIYAVKDKIIMFNFLMIIYMLTFKDFLFEITAYRPSFVPYKNLISEFLKWVFAH